LASGLSCSLACASSISAAAARVVDLSHREFGVEVGHRPVVQRVQRARSICDAARQSGVRAIHANAAALPFADGFFDASCRSARSSTRHRRPLLEPYLAAFRQPGGQIGIAGAG
jgi:hypothetical protein